MQETNILAMKNVGFFFHECQFHSNFIKTVKVVFVYTEGFKDFRKRCAQLISEIETLSVILLFSICYLLQSICLLVTSQLSQVNDTYTYK